MITYFFRSIKDHNVKVLSEFRPGVWISVEKPIETELDYLSNQFGLDKTLLLDATDPYEVPRLEIEDGIIYAFARGAAQEGKIVTSHPIVLIIGENFLITLSNYSFPQIQGLTENGKNLFTTQKTKLFIQLSSILNGTYTSVLNDVGKQVRRLSTIPEKIHDRDILQFVRFEETLNLFLSDLVPTRDTLKKVLLGKHIGRFEEDQDMVEDILLSTEQLIGRAKSNLTTIVNIRDTYSTIITNRLNRVIRVLTVLTVTLTIPMVISGLFGMNVTLPGANNPDSFSYIVSIIIVICTTLLLFFAKIGWF